METRNGPWLIKGTIPKYKNNWIEVSEDQVIRPDGKPGIFGVVKMVPGVAVLPIDDQGFVYLTEEFRYALSKNSIETAGGAIDLGEEPLQAAQRELEEELGIIAEEWLALGLLNPHTSVICSPSYLFLAKKLRFTQPHQEGTEVIRVRKMRFDDAVRMVLDSTITHGPTSVLILKAKEYLSH